MSTKTWVFETNGSTIVQRIDLRGVPDYDPEVPPVLGPVTPQTTPEMGIQLEPDPAEPGLFLVRLQGGQPGLSYAAPLQVGATVCLVAVAVRDAVQELVPYTVINEQAFNDLVGDLDPGQSAVGCGIFSFGPDVDPSGGSVEWELLDNQGRIYSQGAAYSYQVQSSGFANTVLAHSLVTCPTDIPPTLDGQAYQLRWTLTLPSGQVFHSFENIRVTPQFSTPVGAEAVVELRGGQAHPKLVTEDLWDNVVLEVYNDQQKLAEAVIAAPGLPSKPVRNSSGWTYMASIDTSQMVMSYIKPWTLIWKYWSSADPDVKYTENADFWVINPVINQALSDMRARINKAQTTIYGKPDLLFPPETMLTWFRRAADAFNTWGGVFTSVTFTNPSGALREYWLMIAELYALESQYLAEGAKAFDFQGAAISLTVDQTQYLDAMAAKIQARLDNELKPLKQNLLYKGNDKGDGSADPARLQRGAMGSVGISIHPATPWYGLDGISQLNVQPVILR